MAKNRDARGLYHGPIVDAHHHLWDLSLDRHPWLRKAAAKGEGNVLTRDHLPVDYWAAASRHNVVATVHIEAGWDDRDPLGEIAWLDALDKPNGIAAYYVAHANLDAPGVDALLERFGAHERIVGLRDILSWHPDPAKRFAARPDIMDDPTWRRGLRLLLRYDLSFDLLISPWQTERALRLASDFPNLSFILNHCGSPFDRDAEGMARWRDGLRALAGAPNVALKISDLVAYDPHWTLESLREIVLTCIDAFGVERCAFASDYPVAGLHASFDQIFDSFKTIVADFTDDDCARLFEGNARRLYGL
jgi:predicted TIM-barrel fold metal-dependent hydrolase